MKPKIKKGRFSVLAIISQISLFLVLLPFLGLTVFLLVKGFGQLAYGAFDETFRSHAGYTALLCISSVLISCLFGFPIAIYLEEFAGNTVWIQTVRYALSLLSGLPAVFVGMFVLTMFQPAVVNGHTFTSSMIALTIVTLPSVTQGCRHSLQMIPGYYRNAVFALGANASQAFRHLILPNVLKTFGWYFLIVLGRAFGETTAVFLASGGFQATQTLAVDVLQSTMGSQYAFTYAMILLLLSLLTGIFGELAANAGDRK